MLTEPPDNHHALQSDVHGPCVRGPLAGLKVIELSSIVLGPMCGQYLGDMGADIIKIEPPEGDLSRSVGPQRSPDMSALFLCCNRNKRSIVLNLKQPDDLALACRLIAQSDVFIHSIRTQAIERLGLGYAELRGVNPRLVYCHVKGFSDIGEYAGMPAYDDVVQALCGLASLQQFISGEPRYVPAIMADKISSVHAAYAIALALFYRERSGKGQEVQVPMFETMVAFNSVEHLWGGAFEPPHGPLGYQALVKGVRRPYKTRDGYVAFLAYTDAHWQRFFIAIGSPDIFADPRFSTFAARQKNFEFVWAEVRRCLETRTTAEWQQLLKAEDIPHAKVNSLEDLLDDAHLKSIGFWDLREHPSEGLLRMPRNPILMSESPPGIHRLPPRLGEHTQEILREIEALPALEKS